MPNDDIDYTWFPRRTRAIEARPERRYHEPLLGAAKKSGLGRLLAILIVIGVLVALCFALGAGRHRGAEASRPAHAAQSLRNALDAGNQVIPSSHPRR